MKKVLALIGFITAWCYTALAQTAPVAVDDTIAVPKNTSSIISVADNDTDAEGGLLSVSIYTAPQRGTASVINSNQVNYTPNSFYYGPDTLSYIVCDTTALCDTAMVFITVSGSNEPPVANDDYFVLLDTVQAMYLAMDTNDFDPENGPFFVSSVFNPDSTLGYLTLTDNGQVIFNRTPLACGTGSFQYAVCDTFNTCDTATIVITINCPDVITRPEGFSPNGDGKNDKLVFTGLEYFAPAVLKVFNRHGNPVFETEDYQNDWEGLNRDNGKPLPDGTYFYTLELPNKQRYTSYLVISR